MVQPPAGPLAAELELEPGWADPGPAPPRARCLVQGAPYRDAGNRQRRALPGPPGLTTKELKFRGSEPTAPGTGRVLPSVASQSQPRRRGAGQPGPRGWNGKWAGLPEVVSPGRGARSSQSGAHSSWSPSELHTRSRDDGEQAGGEGNRE